MSCERVDYAAIIRACDLEHHPLIGVRIGLSPDGRLRCQMEAASTSPEVQNAQVQIQNYWIEFTS